MNFPSLVCVNEVYKRLALDFNALLAQAVEDINDTLALFQRIETFEIDFSSPNGRDFWLGAYDIADLKSTGCLAQPTMILYARGADEGPRPQQKFEVFSGYVTVIIDVHLSWGGETARKNGEALGCAIEAALIELFNRDVQMSNGQYSQFWTNEVSYNGEIHVSRGELVKSAEGWDQLIRANLNLAVNSPN